MEAGTFRKIIVSFLPVGHTHEDIDQFFSRIAMYLRTRDAHSRLELARIISHLHASSSDWGKVRLVKHWENVANISGWLGERVHAMPSITQWQQFKCVKNPTTGAVMLMVREWPGERGDYWSGMVRNDTSQRIWTTDEIPNLLLEYDSVPPAQSPRTPATKETIAKIEDGVISLLKHIHASEESKADTMKLLKVYSTPAPNFVFAWKKETISSVLGDENRTLWLEQDLDLRYRSRNPHGIYQVTRPARSLRIAST